MDGQAGESQKTHDGKKAQKQNRCIHGASGTAMFRIAHNMWSRFGVVDRFNATSLFEAETS